MAWGWIPSRPAVSRSMVSLSWRPAVCWSLATSRSCGSAWSFVSTRGAHAASSSRSGSSSVYWYCVRLTRLSTCRSCTAWRYSAMPGTEATRLRSRSITSPALALRCSRGLSVMESRPLFVVGFVHDGLGELALAGHHALEGDVGRSLRDADEQAGVLLREEALRHHDGEDDGERERPDGDGERERLVRQHPLQRAVVEGDHPVEGALEDARQPPRLLVRPEQVGAHHGGEREREDGRDADGDAERDGELSEEAPDDPAHEEERDEHRDERHGERDDGEPDLLRALERRLERRVALLDVAGDVLDHDDGVVDHEPGRDGERHEREVEIGRASCRERV